MPINEKEFTEAYQAHWKTLFYQALKLSNDEELAKELIQELFRQLWERRAHIHIETSWAAYLSGALRLKIFEHYRRLARKQVDPIDESEEELFCLNEYLDGKEADAIMSRAIAELHPRCREVFVLSRQDGLPNKVIAAQLGISVKAVEANITRALTYLREKAKNFM